MHPILLSVHEAAFVQCKLNNQRQGCKRVGCSRPTKAQASTARMQACVLQVCNHPDLFEGRSITSSFDLWPLQQQYPSAVLQALGHDPWKHVCLGGSGLRFVPHPEALYRWEANSVEVIAGIQFRWICVQFVWQPKLLPSSWMQAWNGCRMLTSMTGQTPIS